MQQSKFHDYDALVSSFYDAALDASLWPSVLDAAAHHFGAARGLVYTPERRPGDGGFFFSHNIPAEHVQRYAEHYQHLDPWVIGHHSRFGDQVGGFLGNMFIPTRELEKTEFYADHLRPVDIHQLCTAVTKSAPHAGDFISFAMFRGRRSRDFGEHERLLSERISTHLQRAFLISARLASPVGGVSHAMLEAAGTPVILVDALSRVLHATISAARMLDDGTWIASKAGRLRAVVDAEDLAKAISQVSVSGVQGPFSRVLRIRNGKTGAAVHILVARGGPYYAGKAFVVVGDTTSQTKLLRERLNEVYGLTPAEARLCAELYKGMSISEAAELHSVKRSTAQSQLKSVFQKIGLNRQSELTKLLADLASL